jgi:hypothetical protein
VGTEVEVPPLEPLTLIGGYGSPYSRKMRAVLRYRRIPHRWVIRGTQEAEHLPRPPVDLIPVLEEIGRGYAPFLLANAAAIEQGLKRVECEIDGQPWVQHPFSYQAKCLGWLRDAHGALDAGDRGWVDRRLEGTGCESLFE